MSQLNSLASPAPHSLLEIDDLSVAFAGREGRDITVLDRVSLQLKAGSILGLVGESGCGKSTLCRAIIRTLRPPAYIAGGDVLWQGRSLLQSSEEGLLALRWRDIAMVVQSSLDSLNPVLTVEAQLRDVLAAHQNPPLAKRRNLGELLEMVGLEARHLKAYPHQLSGGMRQRVVIAMALLLEPKLLILDEPTTALDVVTQAEILGHILELQKDLGFAILLVTHDLPLALDFCDTIAVMYAGRIVELASSAALKRQARHPYAGGLMQAFPHPGQTRVMLRGVPGDPASFAKLPSGCPFHPRCIRAESRCAKIRPELEIHGEGVHATAFACFKPLPEASVLPPWSLRRDPFDATYEERPSTL